MLATFFRRPAIPAAALGRMVTTLSTKRGSEGMGLPDALKPETVDMIVATAGVVAPKALDITKTMYSGMLKNNPDLLAWFNPAHNVPISVHQPTALANSVVAYASNIRDLSPLLVPGGAIDALNHRHCALGIYPEQYVTVHDNFMAATGNILGSAVTPEIAAAWSDAFLFLAKVCIDKEEALYRMAEGRSGGWSGFMDFEVSEIKDVATDIKSFSFKLPAGSSLSGQKFDFTPGQYLSVKIDPEGNGRTAPRHYTTTSPPGADFLQCTVKKIGGKVSTYLHEQLKVGDKVKLAAPYGVFTAEDGCESAVLMSAGIGVTPMVAFNRALTGKVKLAVHVDKTPESFAYRSEFAGIPTLEKFTGTQGRTSSEALVRETLEMAGANNTFYICGPEHWMNEVQSELLKKGANKVMCEVFGSQLATGCPFAAGK
eukprot:TRINITY_DN7490_c0_g1_i4.p1 TRINITY_DN7490_c0_g1~~TRINITY_DN7490_c0_g1_i4.p1  ORF type:complete len:428 (-),score=97.41 TRINITY_DN7490_c0_g1_i4:438-1721(-)